MENSVNNLEKNKKNILAFGDSLTKGYYNFGLKYHPYSIKMNKLFLENNIDYNVIDSGVNGEVTKTMLERIKTFFEKENFIFEFSHVIIFAGTNDLGSVSSDKIAENILNLHKYVLEKGVKSVLITLPENECDSMYDFYSEKRKKVNEILRREAENIQNLAVCDLDKLIKYNSINKSERKKYWDDHLHFTAEGYDLIGENIFNTVKNLI
jgi:lysophospholipase L1-like esterase